MGEKLIVGVAHDNGVGVHASKDLSWPLLNKWTKRYGDFLIVAAYECDPDVFCRVTHIPGLPTPLNYECAALYLARLPISDDALMRVLRHNRKVAPRVGGIVAEWARVVSALNAAEWSVPVSLPSGVRADLELKRTALSAPPNPDGFSSALQQFDGLEMVVDWDPDWFRVMPGQSVNRSGQPTGYRHGRVVF